MSCSIPIFYQTHHQYLSSSAVKLQKLTDADHFFFFLSRTVSSTCVSDDRFQSRSSVELLLIPKQFTAVRNLFVKKSPFVDVWSLQLFFFATSYSCMCASKSEKLFSSLRHFAWIRRDNLNCKLIKYFMSFSFVREKNFCIWKNPRKLLIKLWNFPKTWQ